MLFGDHQSTIALSLISKNTHFRAYTLNQTHRYSLSQSLLLLLVAQMILMLDIRVTYHMCPSRDRFSSFEKLDGCSRVMSDDRPCSMKGIGMFHIKIFDKIVQKLMEVRYVYQLKRICLLVPWKHWVLKYLLEMVFLK